MSSNVTPTPALSQAQSQQQSGGPAPLDYRGRGDLLDEACNADGSIKPQWAYVLNGLRDMGPEALRERELKARRILRDDGATFDIYNTDGKSSSSWELDPVPHIIDSEDWATIERGLLERAELFNLVLRDIYGQRTLLRHGALPPEALFSHNGFLRACQDIRLPGEQELILHAVDMVRTRGGEMCVLSDRTQTPSGAGYILENRTVMSRVFPSLFRDSRVHRIAAFYQRLRAKLASLSTSDEAPLIAVLTPGSQSEVYFEHAYLANYMGFPLVQSGDLLVRNGYLWMKSLDGLKRVDVLQRCVDDILCDPVELRSDSRLGVPGLLEVVRSGRVAIANPLGSGVLENAIFLKYLPRISKCLLGREPRLQTVPTYWCGDDADLKYVTENIRQLIIKPAFRGSGVHSVWGGDLSKERIDTLLATIHRNRYQIVAQPRLEQAYTPAFAEGKLEPRPTLLRTFCVAADSSYMALPGGLTRIATQTGGRVISMISGSPSKDTWITATELERPVTRDTSPEVARNAQHSALVTLPTRVVENLYWMGRYSERADACLRLLRTVFVLLSGEEMITPNAQRILLQTVTRITATEPGFMAASDDMLKNPEQELLLVIQDGQRAGHQIHGQRPAVQRRRVQGVALHRHAARDHRPARRAGKPRPQSRRRPHLGAGGRTQSAGDRARRPRRADAGEHDSRHGLALHGAGQAHRTRAADHCHAARADHAGAGGSRPVHAADRAAAQHGSADHLPAARARAPRPGAGPGAGHDGRQQPALAVVPADHAATAHR